jgi:hypothetical protein
MKRLALITTALLLMVIAINLTACKKSSTNTSIVGTWQLTNYHQVNVDSTTNPVTVTTLDTTFNDVITFNSDGSANSSGGGAGSYILIGSDSISYVFGPGPPPEKARYTIQGTTLTLFDAPHYLDSTLIYFISMETFKRIN